MSLEQTIGETHSSDNYKKSKSRNPDLWPHSRKNKLGHFLFLIEKKNATRINLGDDDYHINTNPENY